MDTKVIHRETKGKRKAESFRNWETIKGIVKMSKEQENKWCSSPVKEPKITREHNCNIQLLKYLKAGAGLDFPKKKKTRSPSLL